MFEWSEYYIIPSRECNANALDRKRRAYPMYRKKPTDPDRLQEMKEKARKGNGTDRTAGRKGRERKE